MRVQRARYQPIRSADGRKYPRSGEVGIYWGEVNHTDFYIAGDFYDDLNLQHFAHDHGAEIIER